jgi:hypothetical protein
MPNQHSEQIKPNGERCRGTARPGTARCTFHTPGLRRRCAEGRRAGGVRRATRRAVLPADAPDLSQDGPQDVSRALGVILNHTLKGRLDPRVGNAAAYMLSLVIRIQQGAETEQRIADLEQRLEAAARAGGHAIGYHAAGRN